ncbi:GPW/gp25 family protein [Streptomyces sp. CAU 1734]|uniref:GPW/gp25 family protein n=1 Tax=Streptomyces sp. CAU 1734 TaxID=3140360 RepID=UPI00325FE9E3
MTITGDGSGAPFLGTGWRFPILPDEAGRLGYAEGERSIDHCLRALLLTAAGERVMRPGFGTRVTESVFAPGSVQNLRDLENSIAEAVRDHEPRVTLEEVRAEPDLADESRVTVSVVYRIRRSNTKATLVFPYYAGLTGSTP